MRICHRLQAPIVTESLRIAVGPAAAQSLILRAGTGFIGKMLLEFVRNGIPFFRVRGRFAFQCDVGPFLGVVGINREPPLQTAFRIPFFAGTT